MVIDWAVAELNVQNVLEIWKGCQQKQKQVIDEAANTSAEGGEA